MLWNDVRSWRDAVRHVLWLLWMIGAAFVTLVLCYAALLMFLFIFGNAS